MAQIEYQATADYTRARAEAAKHEKEIGKLKAKLVDMAATSKRASKQDYELAKQAKRIREQATTAQDKYNLRLKTAKTLLDQQKITQREYASEVKRAKQQLDAAGRSGKNAFGPQALSQVMSMATGFLSVSAAIGTMTSALREADAVRQRAASEAKQSRMGMGALAQLAIDDQGRADPAKYAFLKAQAEELFASGGAENRDAAARTVFSLASAGALEDLPLFGGMRSSGVVESPDVLAGSARAIITTMGREETGGFRELSSKALAASLVAQSTADEMMQAAAGAGGSAKALGLTDEEVLAAVGMTSAATGVAAEGGTQIEALLDVLEKRSGSTFAGHKLNFKNQPLLESLQQIEAMDLKDAEFVKFFGKRYGRAAYRTLSTNIPKYQETLQSVRQAETTDLIGQVMTLPQTDPEMEAARQAQKASARESISTDSLGVTRNLLDAAIDELIVQQREQGSSEMMLALQRRYLGAKRWVEGREETMLRDLYESDDAIKDPELRNEIGRHLGALVDETRGLREDLNSGRVPAAAANTHSE